MIKIISERHRESHTEYSLQFDLIGERKGNGYGFPVHFAGKAENHAYLCGR